MSTFQYKVVLQLTSSNEDVQKSVISHIHNILKAMERISIELVTHGDGIIFLFENSEFKEKLEAFKEKGVRLFVCKNALDAKKLEAQVVLPFAEIIPSAVAHLIKRQSEGWSYLREA